MLSETNPQALIEDALSEMQSLMLNLYTSITRDEWDQNQAIHNKVLDEVFGLEDDETQTV